MEPTRVEQRETFLAPFMFAPGKPFQPNIISQLRQEPSRVEQRETYLALLVDYNRKMFYNVGQISYTACPWKAFLFFSNVCK
jgi:hypothetical protein